MKNVLKKKFYYCADDNSGAHIGQLAPEDLKKNGRTLLCEEMNDPDYVTEWRGFWYETAKLEEAKYRAKEEADRYEEYVDDEDRADFDYDECYESVLDDVLSEEPFYVFSSGWYTCEGTDWHACGGIATVEEVIDILTRTMEFWSDLAYDLICAPEKVIGDGDGECYACLTLGAYALLEEYPVDFDEDELEDIEAAVAEAKKVIGIN